MTETKTKTERTELATDLQAELMHDFLWLLPDWFNENDRRTMLFQILHGRDDSIVRLVYEAATQAAYKLGLRMGRQGR